MSWDEDLRIRVSLEVWAGLEEGSDVVRWSWDGW